MSGNGFVEELASPSFMSSGSTRFPDPDAGGDVEKPLHQDADISSIFEDVVPAKGRWTSIIEALLKDEGAVADVISNTDIMALCGDAISQLSSEKSLVNIHIPEGRTLAIVGDVHGQYSDLVHHVLPLKAPKRSFLFLGDYVDRGPQSVEVIVLLLCLKVEYPNNVHLLRGNHEEAQTSRIYGFYMEMTTKYPDHASDLWFRVNEVFCHLPVAALVTSEASPSKQIFCAHGGLSPELTDLRKVELIDRVDYGATLDIGSTHIIDGLLWSDPVPENSALRFRPNERGCGFAFGPMATQEFCADNSVALVIRAHQMAMEGYTWNHGNLCLTIFSAPNYCGLSNNLGAVIILGGNLDPTFIQYKSAASKNASVPPVRTLPPFFFQ